MAKNSVDQHERTLDLKLAIPRDKIAQPAVQSKGTIKSTASNEFTQKEPRSDKLFVGNVAYETTQIEFEYFFSQYGRVKEAYLQ